LARPLLSWTSKVTQKRQTGTANIIIATTDFRQYVLKRMDCESEEEAVGAVKEVLHSKSSCRTLPRLHLINISADDIVEADEASLYRSLPGLLERESYSLHCDGVL